MKTIHSSTSIPAALFGKQKLKDATKYRLTTHCVQVESEDGTLYFHTMTGAMLLLEQGDLIQEQEKALVADWFLVPIEHDEMKQLRKLRALMHAVQSKSKKKNHFTVLSILPFCPRQIAMRDAFIVMKWAANALPCQSRQLVMLGLT